MSLQFSLEEHHRPLVSLSCQSSDENMEVDTVSVIDALDDQDSDDDIQVFACYRETKPFPPQLVAGRAMTTELTHCLNDLNLPDNIYMNQLVLSPTRLMIYRSGVLEVHPELHTIQLHNVAD